MLIRHAVRTPRAISGLIGVRAQAGPPSLPANLDLDDPKAVAQGLAKAYGGLKDNLNARLESVEGAVDRQALSLAANAINGTGHFASRPDDPTYTAAFASYFRKGGSDVEASLRMANSEGTRSQIQAAMSIGDNSSGGYLAPTEWDRKIGEAQRAKSPMRRLATVQITGVNAYSTLWNIGGWGSGWVGETAARPNTTSATLLPLTFASGEIYAQPAATQRLLDDADLKVEDWLASQLDEEFSRQEGIAFVAGDGVNKPYGFLQYTAGGAAATVHPGGVLDVVASGAAAAIATPDTLVDFTYGLAAPYRQNATWVMNSLTGAAIAKMKDGQGNFIWREGLIAGQPATLLGRPVEFDEAMPNIEAGALPIAFGDFKAGYLINDRLGIRILRDPFTNKPFVTFYATKRVGAGVADPRAIRLLKIAAS